MAQVTLDGGGTGAGGTVVAPARTILTNPTNAAGAIQQFALSNTPGHTLVVQGDGSLASAAPGAATGYQTIENAGTPVTQRTVLHLLARLIAADVGGETQLDIADLGITVGKLANGILSADATGRGKMADDFFNAAAVLAKIADGAFAADAATRALFGDGIWTYAKLASDVTKPKPIIGPTTLGSAQTDVTIFNSVQTPARLRIKYWGPTNSFQGLGLDIDGTAVTASHIENAAGSGSLFGVTGANFTLGEVVIQNVIGCICMGWADHIGGGTTERRRYMSSFNKGISNLSSQIGGGGGVVLKGGAASVFQTGFTYVVYADD